MGKQKEVRARRRGGGERNKGKLPSGIKNNAAQSNRRSCKVGRAVHDYNHMMIHERDNRLSFRFVKFHKDSCFLILTSRPLRSSRTSINCQLIDLLVLGTLPRCLAALALCGAEPRARVTFRGNSRALAYGFHDVIARDIVHFYRCGASSLREALRLRDSRPCEYLARNRKLQLPRAR